eukprot:4494046-Prorocentrum_lima.AAC.1
MRLLAQLVVGTAPDPNTITDDLANVFPEEAACIDLPFLLNSSPRRWTFKARHRYRSRSQEGY